MAFIEGWPHLRGGLYEGFHCTELSIHLCTAVALHSFIKKLKPSTDLYMIGGGEASPSCACGHIASWGGRQGQVYSKITVGHPNAYGACRIAIEGVHKQWKLTE